MQVRVGDIVRVGSTCAGHFYGFVIEIKDSQYSNAAGALVATIWRPELPTSKQIQQWPLDAHYNIEVM